MVQAHESSLTELQDEKDQQSSQTDNKEHKMPQSMRAKSVLISRNKDSIQVNGLD